MFGPKANGTPVAGRKLCYTVRMVPRTVLLMITPYSLPRLEGISRFARAHGWNLMMADRLLPDEDPRRYDGVLTTLRDAPEAVATARRLLRAKVPTVDLTIERPDVKLPRVVSDHAAIGRAAAAHFRERGFFSLAWFSSGWSNVHRLRYEGFRAGCAALPVRWTRNGLAAALAAVAKPVGVLTYNDVDAARLVAFCRASGFSVPEDVAVLGIGNDAFLCENQTVPISSVEQDLQRNAYEGAELLERLMSATPTDRAAVCRRAPRLTPPGGVVARASSDTLAHPHPLVRAALVQIRRNLGRPFGAPEIAAALGISRSHLDHLFVHETGRSVGKEILAQRLREVKRLLADTDRPITEIARLTGFCNVGHLSNTFRLAEGLSPKAWRKGNLL